ncbi:hypothetical protein GCM10009640_14150 [Agrococcus citreus]|uniref:Uncharacterized protein n=1 Tax=Agrococcus citreus TaxID=84643 RepID=A0ABN1YT74_9MICO
MTGTRKIAQSTSARTSALPMPGRASVATLMLRMPVSALPRVTPLRPWRTICTTVNAVVSTAEAAVATIIQTRFGWLARPYGCSEPVATLMSVGSATSQ